MADNSSQGGVDTIRDIDRSGVKTQVAALDFGGQAGPEQLVTAANALPISVNAANFIFSTNNSSTANLAAGATFTGVIETALNQPSISLDFASDQPAVITVLQYIDSSGTVPVPPIRFTVLGGAGFSGSFVLNGNYVKVQVQNIGLATTILLNMNTAYGTIPAADGYGNSPTAVYGSGDLAGVSLFESVIRGDLALSVQVANPDQRDVNGALVVSDAPTAQRLLASSVGQVLTIDTQGYQTLSISMGTMAATIAGTNDMTAGTTPGAISAYPVVLGAPTSTLAAATSYLIPCLTRYVRLTVTTAGGATYYQRAQALPDSYVANAPSNMTQIAGAAVSATTAQLGMNMVNWGGAAVASTNPVFASPVAVAATNSQTLSQAIVTATAVAVVQVKASAGKLTMLNISNGSANAGYVHLMNNAAATTATASVQTYAIPASVSNFPIELPDGGLYLSAGIAFTVSGAIASGDTTALTAPSLAVNYAFI